MDLIWNLTRLWPVLVMLGAVGAVVTAFARCAVADCVVRIAVRLYSSDAEVRADRLAEWLGTIEEMKPSERPAHAASYLWLSAKLLPTAFRAPRMPAIWRELLALAGSVVYAAGIGITVFSPDDRGQATAAMTIGLCLSGPLLVRIVARSNRRRSRGLLD